MDEFIKTIMEAALENSKEFDRNQAEKLKKQMDKKSIDDSAKMIKEQYDAYVAVGFSEEQAFELIKVMLGSLKISR